MLGHFAIARFAPQQSPTRESRESLFAENKNAGPGATGGSSGTPPTTPPVSPAPAIPKPEKPEEKKSAEQILAEGFAGKDLIDQQRKETAEAANEAAKTPVEKGQEKTAKAMKKVVNSGGETEETRESEERAEVKKVGTKEIENKIDILTGDVRKVVTRLKEIVKLAEKHGKKGDADIVRANIHFLENGIVSYEGWKRKVQFIDQWRSGTMSPETFFSGLKDKFDPHKTGSFDGLLEEFRAKYPNAKNWEEWQVINISDRIGIAQESSQDFLDFADALIKETEGILRTENVYIDSLKKEEKKKEKKSEDKSNAFGIEFMSINQIIESGINVVNAFKKAGNEWSQLKVSKFSHNLGKVVGFLPWGDDAQQALSADLAHKDDEVKDHYEKHLKSEFVPFHEMLTSHGHIGFLDRNKYDGNRFRGSIEYMANKGWLYDMDIDSRTVMGYALIPGTTLPGNWHEHQIKDYIRELDNMNKSGQKKEIERGYARVENLADIPPIIGILDDEMANNNYWAIQGIVKRAFEKGKLGETSGWLCTAIMRHLKDDPVTRKYFPKGLSDKLGSIGISSPAWLTTFFKLDRHDLESYQNEEISFSQAGELAKTISKIETDIQSAQKAAGLAALPASKLDHIVAKVLSSQTVKEEKWKNSISIFDERYNSYRHKIATTQTSLKPGDTDDDFYNVKNGGSEVILMGKDAYRAVCNITTTGDLTHYTKAKSFLEQILVRDEDLRKNLPGVIYDNFKKETKEKLDYILQTTLTHGNNAQLAHVEISDSKNKLFLTLVQRGLISENILRSEAKKGIALAKALVEQLDQG